MIKFPESTTPEEALALYERAMETLERCEAFDKTFDRDRLLALATEEFNGLWQQLGFDAEMVHADTMPTDRPLGACTSEDFDFLLFDVNSASEGKSAEQNRRELAERLHADLLEHSYDEQSLVSAVAEAVIEHGGVEAELEAVKHNYGNVRAAIIGYSLPDFAAVPGVEVHNSDESMSVFNGRICFDLAVWTVPLD
jgi:hypothetical protein